MADDKDDKGVAARLKARDDSVAEYWANQANLQPTPTQAENDLMKVGIPVEEKEDDGSDWDDEHQQKTMMGRLPGGSPYDTRNLEGADTSRPARRGGRRKAK